MKNNMVCDVETGVCGTAGEEEIKVVQFEAPKKNVTLYYVTDPICSHCWALEPVLRRFTLQYGNYFLMKTVMGGLLDKWGDGFADASNGIHGPKDVAGHWKEVGIHTRMPIDGSLWLERPITSSYPPSRVFKMIQRDSEEQAAIFLRKAREAVFVFNRTISEDEVLIDIVNEMGLDGEKIVQEANQPTAQSVLEQDFHLARNLEVRGFPTVILVNEENKGVKIVGARSFETYVQALKQLLETEEVKAIENPALSTLLQKEDLLFSREIEELFQINQNDIEQFIQTELSAEQYEAKEILGELYIEKR